MLYIVSGKDGYQVNKRIKEISLEVLGEEFVNEAEYIDLKDTTLETVFDEALMIPLFADKKVMIVENCDFLNFSKKNDKDDDNDENDELNEEIEGDSKPAIDYRTFIERYDFDYEPTTIIFKASNGIDKRRKGIKEALKKFDVTEIGELDKANKAQFINNECKDRNLIIDEDTKHYLNEILPNDSYTIINEIEKLSLYGEKVNKEIVDMLVSRPLEDKAYLITSAVLQKNTKLMFNYYQDFLKGNMETFQVLATLANQLRMYYQVTAYRDEGYSNDEIAKLVGVSSGRMYYIMREINKYSPKYILRLLNDLSELDLAIKSGKIDRKLGFELFLLKVGAK